VPPLKCLHPARREVAETLERNLSAFQLGKLALLLHLLSTPLSFALCYFPIIAHLPRPFPKLPLATRHKVLLWWSTSWVPDLRAGFKVLKSCILSTYYARTPTPELSVSTPGSPGSTGEGTPIRDGAVDQPSNPTWPLIGYPGDEFKRRGITVSNDYLRAEGVLEGSVVSLAGPAGDPLDWDGGGTFQATMYLSEEMLRRGWKARGAFDEEKAWIMAAEKDKSRRPCHLVVDCDVVVAGSGAGGSVAASVLAEAGMRVAVIEKSSWQPARTLPREEAHGFRTMYERSGFLTTDDGGVGILAGATLGGGTTINWGASWRTPEHIRKEWSETYGCADFANDVFDTAVEQVCERMGVRDSGFSFGPADQVFMDALERMGCQAGPMPRNCQAPAGECSQFCAFGCPSGHKRDAPSTWLADACRHRAVCFTEAFAVRIVTRPRVSPSGQRAREVVGLLVEHRPWPAAVAGSGGPEPAFRIFFRCDKVFAANGAIGTPALLLRSGVEGNGHVGKHLKLHPAQVVWGQFGDDFRSYRAGSRSSDGDNVVKSGMDAPVSAGLLSVKDMSPRYATLRDIEDLACPNGQSVRSNSAAPEGAGRVGMWSGTMFSAFSVEVAQWGREDNHGPMMAVPVGHPGIIAALLPWTSPAQHRLAMSRLDRTALFLVYQRDRGEGSVTLDDNGQPSVQYWPCLEDRRDMTRAMILGLKSLVASGAERIGTLTQSNESECVLRGDGARDVNQYLANVARFGVQYLRTPVLSAHQMGSARMGGDPAQSVFDPNGESWEVKGLFVSDTSAFPSATGANPMVTAMALAHMVATKAAKESSLQKFTKNC